MMNRTYTQKEFLELVDKMRKKIPELVLTTDIIIGFPTESDDDYNDTLKVVDQVEFDSAFMFKYSERKNTIAQRKFKDDVPEDIKTFRMVNLVDKQRNIGFKKNQQHLEEAFSVLIEGKAKKPTQMMGRNDGNKIVVFPENGKKVGEFVDVKINEVTPNTLIGELI